MIKIGILGIGAWATAIANLLSENGYRVVVWSHESSLLDEISLKRENEKYLKNIKIHESIEFSKEIEFLSETDLIVQAIPTQFIRSLLDTYKIKLEGRLVVNVAKGIEKQTNKRISEILNDFGLKASNYAILTGPSHAEEVVLKIPTALVVASSNKEFANFVQKVFTNRYFRVYTNSDVVGCELGGALKNVIAIASGIVDGLKLGDNAKAALITRGLAEITRLGVALGADPITFSGLSGLGDLVATCSSRHSRNRFVGEELAKGRKLADIVSTMNAVAEGVDTTISALNISKAISVEIPITEKVYEIMFEGLNPLAAISDLMIRQTKPEWWW
ncbi:MAG: NAD(P)-dependent glycerol-3-phosphate dehydrogenase [Ignavibacteria bacterium]|nr:NAD(P)-dependent glycerol-3-phosphate dehydrogenase [Ignavibacteria bacterium]